MNFKYNGIQINTGQLNFHVQTIYKISKPYDTQFINPLYTESTLPHYILEESNFNFRYIQLWDLHIPREKWLNYLQTVETLIKRRVLRHLIWVWSCVLWHLIWVCTVCQLPLYASPDYNWLTLTMLGKIFNRWHTGIIFLFCFSDFDISCANCLQLRQFV